MAEWRGQYDDAPPPTVEDVRAALGATQRQLERERAKNKKLRDVLKGIQGRAWERGHWWYHGATKAALAESEEEQND